VVSDGGDRVLALAWRGAGVYRVVRIDVTRRRAEPFCEIALDAFAGDFDGATWLVGDAAGLTLLDVTDARPVALATIPLERRAAVKIVRDASMRAHALVVTEGGGLEHLSLELPPFVLRERKTRDLSPDVALVEVAAGGASSYALVTGLVAVRAYRLVTWDTARAPSGDQPIGSLGDRPLALVAGAGLVGYAAAREGGVRVLVGEPPLVGRVTVDFHGATDASIRLHRGLAAAWDDRGRLAVFHEAVLLHRLVV
jgi:hypothetical protein